VSNGKDEGAVAGGPTPAQEREAATDDSVDLAGLEDELVRLTDAVGAVIERAPFAEREALHDYAVSLVRERLPIADSGSVASMHAGSEGPSRARRSSGAASLVGYGALLAPIGLLLVPVFGLVGMALLVVGVMLVSLGFASGLVGRLTSRS
jgi:hypothetical protein